MDEESTARDPDTTARVLPRGRVFVLGALGLATGFALAAVGSAGALVRWGLVPAASASAGLIFGLLWTLRRERRLAPDPIVRNRSMPQQRHQLPEPRAVPAPLELGPDPWEASLPPALDGNSDDEVIVFPPDPVDSASPRRPGSTTELSESPYLSHDGIRLMRPSDHELERARRAVAGMVADLAPQPGAFDAVCERLLAVGTSMAHQIGSLGRETTDFEKVLGIDLFDRLSETRVTEAGLGVMTWVRWVYAALHEDDGRDDTEFFSPIAVAMASRYGGTSERWQAAIAEPLRQVELGGVVEQIALAVKASEWIHATAADPDAVERILEAPQWM